MDLKNYQRLNLHQAAPAMVNGRSNKDVMRSIGNQGDAHYNPCPEAYSHESIASGLVRSFKDWTDSSVYPGTSRSVWIYTPALFDVKAEPANLIIFNDGHAYLGRTGAVRATQVLDTLHANKQIKPTVAVFITPGTPSQTPPVNIPGYDAKATQRSYEYDAVTARYGEFLINDILPFVEAQLGCKLSSQASARTLCGISSGGICAFNTAWHYPDQFARVISHCGSFTNILGGHNYPYLVRATPRKDIRVFLQSGDNDCTTIYGDWPTANLAMDRALDYAGYDYQFSFGSGGHTLRHGGAIFADTLRWLWRDQ